MTDSITLSASELEALCGGVKRPRAQVEELLARGYWRARLYRGKAILERAHYEAVCAGALPPGAGPQHNYRPQLKSVRLANSA